MSGENEVGTPGSSSAHTSATSAKSDASESECNAENLLTSNYPGSGSDVDIKPFGTFQSSHGIGGGGGLVGSIGGNGGASDLASLIDNKNGKMVLVRPNIPLIANSATENNNKMINNNNNNNNNNNLSTPNKKLFECDVCNMKFSNGANMRRHKMRHTGVKPYECRVCQKRFFRKDHLSEHFTTHIKTLPFHCPICNRGFQRQIAMRAHFQNEHVGQHDLVKTCPLCNYRAGTMKSLRVHFFNRHGIDLDNPGTNASSSLLLALEQSNLPHLMQQAGLAAAAAAFNEAASGPVDASSRSQDNLTPPMHYLTPHVEISMADNNEPVQIGSPSHSSGGTATSLASGLDIQAIVRPKSNPTSSASETSIGGNSAAKNLSNAVAAAAAAASRQMYDSTITPSISLIPIKQEPNANDDNMEQKSTHSSLDRSSPAHDQNSLDGHSPSTSSLTSLIKVSPLKSLLREDLKRRISARAIRSRVSSNVPSALSISMGGGGSINSSAAESSLVLSPGSTSGGGISNSPNGIITSTGETELIITGRKLNLRCLFCNIEFPDQTLYFLHKGCHSESNAWKCNICGEQLQNVYEFNSHLLSKSHQ